MRVRDFGISSKGEKASLYTISNGYMEADFTDYGAALVNLRMPVKGKVLDLCLGYDDVRDYEEADTCFGAVIGRNANRTKNAEMEIGGKIYHLPKNEHSKNNLHSGDREGYHKRLWQVESHDDDEIVFRLDSPDGDQGFPGNAAIRVSYILNDGNGLEVSYFAKADKTTVFNLTNHSYFNLSGHDGGSIEKHTMQIFADAYMPIDEELIPLGDKRPVEGTEFDFREMREIIRNEDYDHHFFFEKEEEPVKESMPSMGCGMNGLGYGMSGMGYGNDSGQKLGLILYSPYSHVRMEVYTDRPGIQVYTGNCLEDEKGKDGVTYRKYSGIALETQVSPDAMRIEKYDFPEYEEGEVFKSGTMYRFSIVEG